MATPFPYYLLPGEDRNEYEALAADYEQEFDPQSEHESFLVNQLIDSRWKLRRFERLQAEAGNQVFATAAEAQSPDAALVAALQTPNTAPRPRIPRMLFLYPRWQPLSPITSFPAKIAMNTKPSPPGIPKRTQSPRLPPPCPARICYPRFLMARTWFAILLTSLLLAAESAPPPGLTGFTPASAREQFAREQRFDSSLNRQNLQQWLQRLSSRPHHVGSPAGKENADFIAAQFRAWGYETTIETFYPLFPTPRLRRLEMLKPGRFVASLEEPALPEDPTSGQRQDQLPVYNAYSIDGDVTAPLVYVNYGLPADYETLARYGIDVKGKIVLARYGHSWRGIKPKVAAEHGAIGCIIYSDPHEDGFFVGDAYPKGGWRTSTGAQRGSVMDMPTHPGDPLTPFVGATRDATRLPREKAATLTRIPVLPISWADAQPLLAALGGPVAPEPFRGALPLTYHLGPGPATVHLQLEFDWKLTPAYDIIARLPGGELADEWVIRGNHHDAWVFGASDPVSGLVPMMEEARAIGLLARSGWKPRRSIVYTVWDGEEPMLLGSTEWGEQHAAEIRRHAVAYINSDANGRGFAKIAGSHTLEQLATEATRDVNDPEHKVSALARYRAQQLVNGTPDDKRSLRETPGYAMDPLGSGSDYTVFLDHLGIASANIGFSEEEASDGVYHSIYDSYSHFTRFVDPDFQYSLALAQLGGRFTMRLANAETLPLRFDAFTRAVAKYLEELTALATTMREQTEERNTAIRTGALDLAANRHIPFVVPALQTPVPYLDFAPLQNGIARLKRSVEGFNQKITSDLPLTVRKQLDQILMNCDRALLSQEGLPRRPWYRHQIYAPGFYTGYGVKTLPGVREAIEERNWEEAGVQIPRAAKALEAMASEVDRAAKLLAAQPQ
ncbi:MAG: M28 family peptidase [Acidobacteria bacterium]|nr:M28 family peptidase [Acidobacteriota bacterium]